MSVGGLSCPILHCIFSSGSVTHYTHDVDPILVDQLPNLYAVCLANRTAGKRNVFGGFFIKTTYSHDDVQEFGAACKAAMSTMKELQHFLDDSTSLLPAKIAAPGTEEQPFTENELLGVIFKQYVKFHEVGQA